MNISKDDIQKIIDKIEESEAPFYEACKMLKSIIKWEPLLPDEYPDELWEKIRKMNKRNKLILQFKHDKGYGDGRYGIFYRSDLIGWVCGQVAPSNPELTFEKQEQGEECIEALGLNAE